MNKGRNVAILMGCLLVLSLLTLLTRTFGDNRTGVIDNVRYVRDSDPANSDVLYEFYFVGDEVMQGVLSQDESGTYNIVVSLRVPIERDESEIDVDINDEVPDYTLVPYAYSYSVRGETKKAAEVTYSEIDPDGGEIYGKDEEPFGRFSKNVFKTMIFGKKPLVSVLQAVIVAAIAAGGVLIIFFAEELWHFFNRKGEDEIPEWHDMDIYKRVGGVIIALSVVLLIVFIII